jgi:hypothetical protein
VNLDFVRNVVGKSRIAGVAVVCRTANSYPLADTVRALSVLGLGLGSTQAAASVALLPTVSTREHQNSKGGRSMSPANGHAQKYPTPTSAPPPAMLAPSALQVPAERVKELVAALEVPFDPSQIEWRVMNSTKNQRPARGQVVPYADQRAYTDRLNALFTPGRMDAEISDSYLPEFRTEQRREDCCEGAGHV